MADCVFTSDPSAELQAAPPTASLTRRKKLLYAAVVIIAIPMLAETAVRIRDAIRFGSAAPAEQLYIAHPKLGKVLRPGASLAGATTQVQINSLGFRGAECRIPKPPGTFRIACLGGSTTFGTYSSSDDTTWPVRLQAMLQERFAHPRFEIVNAGVPGYRLQDSRINLLERVLPLEPDLVLIYHACNDIKLQQAIAYGKKRRTVRKPMIGTRWLSKHSTLFNKVAKNVRIMLIPDDEPDRHDTLPNQAVKNFRQHLDALLAECDQRNIPAMLCTMATQFRANQPENVRRRAAGTALYYNPNLSVEGLIRSYQMFNAEIKAAAVDYGLPCADVFAAVPPDTEHFGDSVHFTDEGCRRVAERVFQTLATGNLIPGSSQLAATN